MDGKIVAHLLYIDSFYDWNIADYDAIHQQDTKRNRKLHPAHET